MDAVKNERLDELDKKEERLKKQIAEVQEEKVAEREKTLTEIVEKFKAQLEVNALELQDAAELLGFALNREQPAQGKSSGAGSKKPTAKVTHRNDRGEGTWAGKGRKPNWLTTALDNGRSLDEFLVSS
ncbi:DNA-binding protein H-NS [Variovorax boronicumulans]|uniref:DNA-binding protein H-NS n=1 Tax=Variovorax boronicumulans TaxID=436515 RepID=A0AAW8E955_9BURK|nr:H-NS histone family protein [Variovorax boronicumulans]MDP9882406.1 DNA-binding protein H-NS [Variovorax boronicumulans]MDP9927692.1 DNA-binding protein H-NS [Variovorax boronicumulans]